WANASYDHLFRFGSRPVTNKVALVLMDEAARIALPETQTNWDRALHAAFLNRLADGGCPLVVFDVFFLKPRDPQTDSGLAAAMRRQGHVVLAAKVIDPKHPGAEIGQILRPHQLFLDAAATWGI